MFADLLVHQVEVRRRSGRTDRLNQPVDSNPGELGGTLVGTFPCRLTRGTRGLVMEERSLDVFEDAREMFTLPDVDIREDDGVRITDPSTGGVVVPIGKVKIKNVVYDSTGPHHLEVMIIVQRGPQ